MGLASSLLIIVYIFIVLVIAYITIGFFKVPRNDIIIIAISLLILIITISRMLFFNNQAEHFSNDVGIADIQKFQMIDLEEDITSISPNLVNYVTSFNKTSYPGTGNNWINMITPTDVNTNFNFEMSPVYNRKTGFYFGNNRLMFASVPPT